MADTNIAEDLVSSGQFREAAKWLDSQPRLNHFEQVLRAWVEFELGAPEVAYGQAESLLKRSHDRPSIAYCLMVSGRSLGRMGSIPQAIPILKRSVAIAAEHDGHLEADFLALLVSVLLSWVGIEPVLSELPRLHRVALKAGNRSALIHFHIASARVAAMRGRQDVAAREISLAERLLDGITQADLHWRIRQVQASIAMMDGDVEAAKRHSEECLRLAENAQAAARIAFTLGNLANLSVSSGDFEGAKILLSRCLKQLGPAARPRLAALSTGVALGIRTDDVDFASSMATQGEGLTKVLGAEQSYYRLWFELHRMKWAVSRGAYSEALVVAEESLPAVARLADRELQDRFQMLSVEALVKSDRSKAEQRLTDLCSRLHRPSLEMLGEMLRVAAVVSYRYDKSWASHQLVTAERLLSFGGLLGVSRELHKTAATLEVQPNAAISEGGAKELLLEVGLLLKLGRHPRVLGQALQSLLVRNGLMNVSLVDETASNCSQSTRRDLLKVLVGETGDTRHWLVAPRGSFKGVQLVWNSIVQIASAALAVQFPGPKEEQVQFWEDPPSSYQAGMIIASDKTVELLNTTRKLAASNIPVLITGESGTGKELLARALHDGSPRANKPFIPFNCSAVSRDMLDAQLFGYRKGAFTGANDAFQGVIRAAAGGTLFLDEIGEVPVDIQPKLLRFLESGEIHPLGEPRPLHVDVRVVAATNADLEQMVTDGRYRADLFYRLNVVRLEVPALRQRREEVPPLVQHYLDKYSRESQRHGLRVADETMEYLVLYNWPGNVRQLANEIRRMVALAENGAVLMPEHLSHAIASSRHTVPASERVLAPTEFVVRMDQPMAAAMAHLERSMIQYALKLSNGKLEEAAQRLRLSRKGLYLKRNRLQVVPPTDDDESGTQTIAS